MPVCKKCNQDRTEEYFYKANNYFHLVCKLCRGIKPRNKFNFKPTKLKDDYDKRKQYLVLLRLKINNGQATDGDIINLTKCYTELYGSSIPYFTKRIDTYVFMWEKLKEFKKNDI